MLTAIGASLWVASRRSADDLRPIREQLRHLEALHASTTELHSLLLRRLDRQGRLDERQLARVRSSVESLLALDSFQAETTPAQLQRARQVYLELERDPGGTGLALLEILHDISRQEQSANRLLVERASRDSARFHTLLLAVTLGLPLAGATSWLLFTRGIRRPLQVLETLMQDLGQPGRARRTANPRVDPLVQPLYTKYDEMVDRLDRLEGERDQREQQLQARVREAASTLLAQQQALNAKERLAATGELAAELAHDLKSPLAGIEVAASRLAREEALGPYRERLDAIRREASRAARILSDLIARSRWTEEPPRDLDLSRLVAELVELLRYQVPPGLELRSTIPAGERARLPGERTRHVLLNVLVNAIEAIAETGRDRGTVTVSARRADDTLIVEVADDGPGFPESVLRDGVRAFATRKESGTGLGLVVVRRYALDLEGRLELSNRPAEEGGGALVRLRLPQPRPADDREDPSSPPSS